jgi:hypothetical protein
MPLPIFPRLWHTLGMRPTESQPLLTTLVLHDLDSGTTMVELETGVLFPSRIAVSAPGIDGLQLEILLEVEDRRPVVSRFALARAPGAPPLGAGIVGLPLGRIFDQVTSVVANTYAQKAASDKVPFGHVFTYPSDTGARAVAARRRYRPVSEAELKQVAAIAQANSYDPRKQIASELHVSDRTASRWLAAARARGLIKEGT